MPPADDIKRLRYRAWHRGTREADMLVGGFFDAHHRNWGSRERALFAELLNEQDVDILAWAHGTAEPPERLRYRAWHRGTREADMLVGGFFEAHQRQWDSRERALFAELLDEQDVDILAWAHGTAEPPERFAGPMIEALRKLDYIRVAR